MQERIFKLCFDGLDWCAGVAWYLYSPYRLGNSVNSYPCFHVQYISVIAKHKIPITSSKHNRSMAINPGESMPIECRWFLSSSGLGSPCVCRERDTVSDYGGRGREDAGRNACTCSTYVHVHVHVHAHKQ